MGLFWRHRTPGRRVWINLSSGSRPSVSAKPRRWLTLNSRGVVTVNFGRGLRWRGRVR